MYFDMHPLDEIFYSIDGIYYSVDETYYSILGLDREESNGGDRKAVEVIGKLSLVLHIPFFPLYLFLCLSFQDPHS